MNENNTNRFTEDLEEKIRKYADDKRKKVEDERESVKEKSNQNIRSDFKYLNTGYISDWNMYY